MHLVCPICLRHFRRPYAWVKRVNVSYCSRACAAEGAKVRVIRQCVSCGKDFELVPSQVHRYSTCSAKCSTLRRVARNRTGRPSSRHHFGAYRKRIEAIAAAEVCCHCGRRHGPWIVRDVRAELMPDGEVVVDDHNASLWCRDCHLHDIQPLALAALKGKA